VDVDERDSGGIVREMTVMATAEEIAEENRKIRFLRMLVDFSIQLILQGDIPLEDALNVVEGVKNHACRLFPGKEETFELIYRPRYRRILTEKYGPSFGQ
jgi:hemerythrin-like domain-containing protein